jgi:hypothetical protein
MFHETKSFRLSQKKVFFSFCVPNIENAGRYTGRTEAAGGTGKPSDSTRLTALARGWTVSQALVPEDICASQVMYLIVFLCAHPFQA